MAGMEGGERLALLDPEAARPKEKPELLEKELFQASREMKKREFAKDLLEFADTTEKFGDMSEYIGVLTSDEINGLIGNNEKNRYTLIASLSDQIGSEGGLTQEEVEQVTALKQVLGDAWELVKDVLVPEWYEIPLMALPVAGEAVVAERLTRMGLAVEKLLPQIERVKKLGNFGEKGVLAIDSALELAKKGDLTKLKAIIRLLVKSKEPGKIQVATELAKVKKEVQLIKIEGREAKGTYEAMDKLVDTNLNRLFARGKPRYGEVREDILSEIRNFETRHKVKQDPNELHQYAAELKELLESHKVDTTNLKTLEDMKNYLLLNH
ncbi:MAG: hypothetical protein PHQ95_00810 [Candidatus Gracilibacteria bacterium]|nr:hypothetical protein [Candidatus Gracilibacteria bacterium]